MKYKTGLIIGRFQPFHRGHLYLVRQALKSVDLLIIAVGSANINDENNPFSFDERKKFIEASLNKYKLLNKIQKIVSIDDYPDDDDFWFTQLEKKTGSFDIAFGNNEWVNGILESRGVKIIRFPLFKRDKYEGVKIREEIRKSKNPHLILKKYIP
ncbi:MAG: adenylyltransferase/cytidyltransferase family protein [Patescibacteria group bacterium]